VLAGIPACLMLAACGSSSLTYAPPPPQASYAERTAAVRSIEAPRRRVARRNSGATASAYEPGADETGTTYVQPAVTPNVGTPEWKREEAHNEREETRVKSIIQSICRGC